MPTRSGPLSSGTRSIRWPILGLVVVFLYGVGGYMILGYAPIDALYMAALALTTAGFTPVGDLDSVAKGFTVSIAVLGVTMFLVILALVTSIVTEGRIGARARRRRMERRVAKLDDHYIVCAYGRVGRSAARELEAEGVPFIVLDIKEALEEWMRSDGVHYMIGNPASEDVLKKAGVEQARGMICAMDDDSENVFVTIVAKSLNPAIYVVARASAPETPEVLYRAGADRVVSPYISSGSHMGRLVLRPNLRDYLDVQLDERQKLRLDEIFFEEDSPAVGKTLADACGDAVPLLLQRRTGETIANPPSASPVQAGDIVLQLATDDGSGTD